MNATAKVSQHIHDISPSLSLRRDKAHTTYPTNRRRPHLNPPMDAIQEIDQNYTWRKLPNISAYKNAIVRNKVCEGLMYLLPSNKSATSLARPYSTELGAIFNEPYHRFKPEEYNEENVMQSSKVHFSPNTHATRLAKFEQVKRNPHDLNSDSKRSYDMYSTLASKNNKSDDKREGKGNLRTQVRSGQAEQLLQEEVDGILASAGVHEIKTDEQDEEFKAGNTMSPIGSTGKTVAFQDQQHTSQPEVITPLKRVREFKGQSYERKSANYSNYNELRNAQVPRPQIPVEVRSKFLNEQKTQEIWEWLNWDFKKTKFQHFLEVCS